MKKTSIFFVIMLIAVQLFTVNTTFSRNIESANHSYCFKAISSALHARKFLTDAYLSGRGNLTHDESRQVIRHMRQSLDYGKNVNLKLLDSRYPGFGNYFNKLMNGQKLHIDGQENHNINSYTRGNTLIEDFLMWYEIHEDEIRHIKF